MTGDAHHTLGESPESAFVVAILHQAMVDLRATAPAQEREASCAFFSNQRRHLEMLCDLVGLDHEDVQQAVQRQYPEWLASHDRQ
jgi:hypothetical protein